MCRYKYDGFTRPKEISVVRKAAAKSFQLEFGFILDINDNVDGKYRPISPSMPTKHPLQTITVTTLLIGNFIKQMQGQTHTA